jgi:hypothetical protein
MKKSQTMPVWLSIIAIKCAPLAGALAIMANVHAPLAFMKSTMQF